MCRDAGFKTKLRVRCLPYPGRGIEVLHPCQKIEDASRPMNRQQDDHKELHNLQGRRRCEMLLAWSAIVPEHQRQVRQFVDNGFWRQ